MHKFLILGLLLASVHAFAIPLPRSMPTLEQQARLRTPGVNFEGTILLNNCSGSLIMFEGAQITDAAMVLTNGHCYEEGMPPAGKFVSHRKSDRRFKVLSPTSDPIGMIQATEVIYATMTMTDISIYKVNETYESILKKWNIHPMILSSQHPQVGTPIEIISSYWRRGYACKIEAFVDTLREGQWAWRDSLRYSRPGCDTIGGTSGSPIVEAGTRKVIGINNTGNEDGEKCTINNPCEIDKNGKMTYQRGLSYGQETYWIYSCVNAKREFDLATPGCALLH